MLELAQQAGRVFGPGGPGPGIGHHVGWLGPLSMLLVIALLVAGAIIIVRMLASRQQPATATRGPVQILEERFARGEIDEEEFRTRRDALRA